MTSTDNVVTVEMFNAGIENLKIEIQRSNEALRKELNTEIRVLSTRMDGMNDRISDIQNYVSWSFALTAVFVAIIGIIVSVVVAFAPSIWAAKRKPRKSTLGRSEIREIVSQQITEALNSYFGGKAQ